jgi:Mg2+-importing ATPase
MEMIADEGLDTFARGRRRRVGVAAGVAAVAANIAGDAVDREQLAKPRSWDIRSIRMFMTVFGLVSSLFDLAPFAVLRIGFDAGSTLFRSGWFLESVATGLAVMLVLRTNRRFWRSRPGRAMLITSIAVAAIMLALSYLPLAGVLGLTSVPLRLLAALADVSIGYIGVNEFVKVGTGLAA